MGFLLAQCPEIAGQAVSDLRQTSVGPAQTVWIFNPSSGEEEEGNETPGPELTAFVTGVPLLFSTSSNFSRVCVRLRLRIWWLF